MTQRSCECNKKAVEGISCSVKSCEYHNGEHKCTAGCIAIGPENACCCSETVCATYRRKDNG